MLIIILWYKLKNSAVIHPPEWITDIAIFDKAYFEIVALDWHMTLTFL